MIPIGFTFNIPDPYYVQKCSAEEFLLGMLSLGKPLEVSLVGDFGEVEGRGSRRDIDLPMHRDGEYSAALAAAQGDSYVEVANIDYVGLYCLVADAFDVCVTMVGDEQVVLQPGEALIFDNQKVLHGRKGPVGQRLLIRMWIQRK